MFSDPHLMSVFCSFCILGELNAALQGPLYKVEPTVTLLSLLSLGQPQPPPHHYPHLLFLKQTLSLSCQGAWPGEANAT